MADRFTYVGLDVLLGLGQVSARAIERYRRLPASNRTGVPAIRYAGKAAAACSGVISAMASMRRLRSSNGSIGYEPENSNDAEGRQGRRTGQQTALVGR
jgi:hypothetical protein